MKTLTDGMTSIRRPVACNGSAHRRLKAVNGAMVITPDQTPPRFEGLTFPGKVIIKGFSRKDGAERREIPAIRNASFPGGLIIDGCDSKDFVLADSSARSVVFVQSQFDRVSLTGLRIDERLDLSGLWLNRDLALYESDCSSIELSCPATGHKFEAMLVSTDDPVAAFQFRLMSVAVSISSHVAKQMMTAAGIFLSSKPA